MGADGSEKERSEGREAMEQAGGVSVSVCSSVCERYLHVHVLAGAAPCCWWCDVALASCGLGEVRRTAPWPDTRAQGALGRRAQPPRKISSFGGGAERLSLSTLVL